MRWNIVIALIAYGSASLAGAQPIVPSAKEPQITASGRGETHLAPSLATVQLVVSTTAANAGDAASQNAARVAATIAAIKRAGVSAEDVTQSSFNITQTYDNKSHPTGFSARSSIRALVRRVEDAGKVIDAAVSGGATEIGGVLFSAANIEQARRLALGDAVRQARSDAEAIAAAAGGHLGRILSLNTGIVAQPYDRDMARLESVVGTSASYPTTIIPPRELTVTALVSGAWEFVQNPVR
ncbi:MAG TPA: SIMPL domain-containing protein [Gemmatimonadaceae bacterium]|nr:SIMPL domain-containing protein [Gemmatimonadaceae bacterium]